MFNTFFRLTMHALVAKVQPDKVVRWCPDGEFWRFFASCVFQRAACSTFSDLHSKIRTKATPCVQVW